MPDSVSLLSSALERRPRVARGLSAVAAFSRFLLVGTTVGLSACADARDGPSPILEDGVPAEAFSTWSHYLGDPGRSHYSTLSQIDTTNVADLEVAWTYASGGLVEGRNSQIQHSPLIVGSELYGQNPRQTLFKVDARTGEELWKFDLGDGGLRPGYFGSPRGLMRWVSEDGSDERIYFGTGPYLHATDADTGELVASFGDAGRVDMRVGLGRNPEELMVGMNTPGAVFEDLVIVGSRTSESPGSAPGFVRAYDARSGELVWTFHTIPQPGELGYDTWPADAYTYIGGANNWSGMALDVERGLVFVPTGSAAFDYYGGDRTGDNLFANTLLALDARTGARIWHYQFVKHDIWDRDLPATPNLVTLERDGELIPAVAQITKSAHIYVFHRETGEPLFPIEAFEVPASFMLGESVSPTQALPTRPEPYARQILTEDMLYTPDAPAQGRARPDGSRPTVLERFRELTSGGQFIPPDTIGVITFPGLDGGGEWGGAAVDPTKGVMYTNGSESPFVIRLNRIDPETGPGEAIFRLNCTRCHDGEGQGVVAGPSLDGVGERMATDSLAALIRDGRGPMPAHPHLTDTELSALVTYLRDPTRAAANTSAANTAVDGSDEDGETEPRRVPYGLSITKLMDARGNPANSPPWGTLNAIDLNTGETLWQVPLGDDESINDPEHPVTGLENYGGPVVTAGGVVFIAATKDAKIRAFHARTGEQLWEADLPAAGYATPATYEADGRQYLVVAAGGGKLGTPSGDRYVAFALPGGGS